ncbi:hypothetical protein HDV05_006516 [Chytridiales sp. JEL 0842]|nr:hypothetical protein HDV05_006516 [Chytridiales sp. JEL 0842]
MLPGLTLLTTTLILLLSSSTTTTLAAPAHYGPKRLTAQPASLHNSNVNYEPGRISATAFSYKDCADLRTFSEKVCGSFPVTVDRCITAFDQGQKSYDLNFQFAPSPSTNHNAKGFTSSTPPSRFKSLHPQLSSSKALHDPAQNEQLIVYLLPENENIWYVDYTPTSAAQCAWLESQINTFCSYGLQGTALQNCLNGYGREVGFCYYVMILDDRPTDFLYAFDSVEGVSVEVRRDGEGGVVLNKPVIIHVPEAGKIGSTPAPKGFKGLQTSSSEFAEGGEGLYTPEYDEAIGKGYIKTQAKSYADCTYLRGKGADFCDGLPVYDPKTGSSPHGDCLTGWSLVGDACVAAVDQGKVPFEWKYEFVAPGGQSSSGEGSKEGNEGDLDYNPIYDSSSGTRSLVAYAKTYADCAHLSSRSSEFCEGLPAYFAKTRASPHGDCLTGFSRVADQCISAVDQGRIPFEFKYSFTNPAVGYAR